MRIEIPFNWLIFQGGLKTAGKLVREVREVRGEEQYTINHYQDLTPFLGERGALMPTWISLL